MTGVNLAAAQRGSFDSARRGEPLNRARNIDSQFGSEQKSGKTVSFLLQPRLIFFPTRLTCRSLARSFFPVHRFERHSAVTWLYSFARGKGFLHLPSTILPLLACPPSACPPCPPCDSTIASATLFSVLVSFFFLLAQTLRHCICI